MSHFSLFVGPAFAPLAGGRWFNVPEEIDELKQFMSDHSDKDVIVADTDSDPFNDLGLHVPSEHHIDRYLELSEVLDVLTEDNERIALKALLDNETSYYMKDPWSLVKVVENSILHEGTMEGIAWEQFENQCVEHPILEEYDFYIDFAQLGNDIAANGNFLEFEHDGKNYVLEIL